MPGYDPTRDGPYGEWLKSKGVQTNAGQTVPRRRETLDAAGRRVRTVAERTESGAVTVTRNRTSERGEHQDVHVHAPLLTGSGRAVTP